MSTSTIGAYTAAITIDGATHFMLIQPGNSSTAYKKISRNVLLGVTGQPADISTVQSLTNKTLDNTNTITLKDTLFTLQDDGDPTKQAKFQLSGITTATTRTYILPNASSTLVDIATTQTLTSKTLTSPTITGGTYDNGTITVDSIAEHTAAAGVTIDGVKLKDGALATNNSVVTTNITDAAVTPAKLLAGTGTGWAWQTWTPTFTNLTVGNGTLTAFYIQTGKTVICRIRFSLGTLSSISGSISFTVPVTASAGVAAVQTSLGVVHYDDVGVAGYTGSFDLLSTTSVALYVGGAAGTYVNSVPANATVPLAFSTGDFFSGIFIYEAA